MDPTAALQEIRELLKMDTRIAEHDGPSLDRLLELIDGLDGWMSKGGFLPEQWRKGRP